MVKKAFKAFLAVVVSFAVFSSAGLSVFAAEREVTPVVVISGMAAMPLTLDGENVWTPSPDRLFTLVKKILIPTVNLLLKRDFQKFYTDTAKAIEEFLYPLECDDDGNSICKVEHLDFSLSADNYSEYYEDDDLTNEMAIVHSYVDAIGGKNVYFFNYDWRMSPLDHADDLKDFIDNVRAETKSREVCLVACSMGGTVLLSYLEKYTAEGIKNCIFASTAFQGTSVAGELFQRKVSFDKEGLILRINQLGKKGAAQVIIPLITGMLDKLGIMDFAVDLANGLVLDQLNGIYKDLIEVTFGHMPGVWALVADEYYVQAKSVMLDPVKNEKLIEKTDQYHDNIQTKAEEIISGAENTGCEVYIISQYNRQGLPVSPFSTANNSDFLVDTVYSSGGAVVADLGKTLPSDYKQANTSCGHNHLSADKVVDASACMRPERTWFIKDMAHIDFPYGSDASELLIWLSTGDDQGFNIFSSEKFPQFMKFNANTGRLTAVIN
ncbi:MAG: alpha/beta hydrolase [Clostridiales bacterium]|nr:alpha/beta hydrolase [Clostridiales bacterium]